MVTASTGLVSVNGLWLDPSRRYAFLVGLGMLVAGANLAPKTGRVRSARPDPARYFVASLPILMLGFLVLAFAGAIGGVVIAVALASLVAAYLVRRKRYLGRVHSGELCDEGPSSAPNPWDYAAIGVAVAYVGVPIQAARDTWQVLSDSLPAGAYQYYVLAIVVGVALYGWAKVAYASAPDRVRAPRVLGLPPFGFALLTVGVAGVLYVLYIAGIAGLL